MYIQHSGVYREVYIQHPGYTLGERESCCEESFPFLLRREGILLRRELPSLLRILKTGYNLGVLLSPTLIPVSLLVMSCAEGLSVPGL